MRRVNALFPYALTLPDPGSRRPRFIGARNQARLKIRLHFVTPAEAGAHSRLPVTAPFNGVRLSPE
jgi:hypothetical protein